MKLILLTLLTLISTQIFADDASMPKKGEKLEMVKTKVLARVDKHISTLQTARTCISSASDKDAMKACRAPLKSMREEFKAHRKMNRDKRKNKK